MNIEILVYRVGRPPAVETIDNGLRPMQKLVGEGAPPNRDCITSFSLPRGLNQDELAAFANDEGLLIPLPFNRMVGHHHIVGTFFITGMDDEGESISLTNEQVSQIIRIIP